MPVVTFQYDDLTDLLGKEVPIDTLLEKIPMLGADLHSYDRESGSISIEFFPDRPDLYSVEGAARALRTFLGIEKGLRTYPLEDSGIVLHLDESVRNVRPFMVAGVVRDVRMSDHLIRSLMELQEKLHLTMGRKRSKVSIGVHDLDKVTPPFTFKAVHPRSASFVPLGKTKRMDLEEILEEHEKGKDYAYILEGKENYPLLVDSMDQVLSFPPIINGTLTMITDSTKNVLLDVTGTDRKAVSGALNIVATAIAERGGRIGTVEVKGLAHFRAPVLEPTKWSLDIKDCNSWLGSQLTAEQTAESLERMGFGCSVKGGFLDVLSPATRLDILHPVDLMEDVAKGYGYENYGLSLPKVQTFGEIRRDRARGRYSSPDNDRAWLSGGDDAHVDERGRSVHQDEVARGRGGVGDESHL